MIELGTYVAFALLLVLMVGVARAWDRSGVDRCRRVPLLTGELKSLNKQRGFKLM